MFQYLLPKTCFEGNMQEASSKNMMRKVDCSPHAEVFGGFWIPDCAAALLAPSSQENYGIISVENIKYLRTLDTVAAFYGVNFKLYNFFCKKYNLFRIFLYSRICNRKVGYGTRFAAKNVSNRTSTRLCYEKKKLFIFHWRTKIFWVINTNITHSNS